MPPTAATLSCYAITAPGLEPLAAAELRQLGVSSATAEPGGVAFAATPAQLVAANLWLRTASRVIVRIAEFTVTDFRELERRARLVRWDRFVGPGRPPRFRVTCRKSRLYHSDAVAERLYGAVEHRIGTAAAARAENGGGDEEGIGEQLFVVRLFRDRCTISADSSGALLHLRGYRQAIAKAPLRETLAAAMLLGAGWPGDVPLVDPMCGAGTIPIEGALLARRMAPGLGRDFAARHWPELGASLWRDAETQAHERALPQAPAPIVASDRDAGAVAATLANAERAGVLADLEVAQRPLSALEPPPGVGWLVSNPPYGLRVGESDALRDLYARLGQVAHTRFAGWTVALLSADRRLEGQVGVRWREALRTANGGIPVRLVVAGVEP